MGDLKWATILPGRPWGEATDPSRDPSKASRLTLLATRKQYLHTEADPENGYASIQRQIGQRLAEPPLEAWHGIVPMTHTREDQPVHSTEGLGSADDLRIHSDSPEHVHN